MFAHPCARAPSGGEKLKPDVLEHAPVFPPKHLAWIQGTRAVHFRVRGPHPEGITATVQPGELDQRFAN
jgi:hypothetical protein